MSAALFAGEARTNSVTIASSGGSGILPISGNTGTFEELISGSPSTVSIVLQACMTGGTCDTLETNTSTSASQLRKPSITAIYLYFKVTASWTGGTNVAITVNGTIATSSNGALPAGATYPVSNTATAHNFLTGFTQSTGLFTKAQPSSADLSDVANVVFKNQANAFSTGLQDLSAADFLQPVKTSDPGTCTAGQTEFNSVGVAMKLCAVTNTWTPLATGPVVSTVNGNSGAVTLNTSNLISVYAWSGLPTCTSGNVHVMAFVSNLGDVGSNWQCLQSSFNSLYEWRPSQRVVLAQTSIPIIISSSGTIGVNGALTGVVAFSRVFNTPGAYVFYPANAITGANTAGFYWTVFSSTTAGTVFNNTWDGLTDLPTVPVSNTAFSGTTGQAFTQTVAAVTLFQLTIPGGVMGNRGMVTVWPIVSEASTAGAKLLTLAYGAASVNNSQTTGAVTFDPIMSIRNLRSNSQLLSQDTLGHSGEIVGAIDSTADQTLAIKGTLSAAATDYFVLEGLSVEVVRP